ncbi:putative Cytochrome P450, family 94, subfamily D, polypeptide 1 [Hibiscus syriacus]|uniref:Cytochrome P450, family 94, subfamily D, polypeptide 1 n=1 Tax=Hibiscus syriacus TaxID=106335 RepID=A0A6A3CTH8_HIBSY|nr:putative Cytochrome P450, family 94, subfamily D, polypeptide 1 [Hibiscus syriacus]
MKLCMRHARRKRSPCTSEEVACMQWGAGENTAGSRAQDKVAQCVWRPTISPGVHGDLQGCLATYAGKLPRQTLEKLKLKKVADIEEESKMEGIQHKTVSVNGINMHVAEKGEGPLILFLYGFPDLWCSWRHQITALAALGYRALAPDLCGYDRTDAPVSISDYTCFQVVGDLIALLDAVAPPEKEDKVFIVGHDWGAIIAWSTTEAIHLLRRLMEKYREKYRDLHMAFLDLEKAYDSVPRDTIWKTLETRWISTAYIWAICDMIEMSAELMVLMDDVDGIDDEMEMVMMLYLKHAKEETMLGSTIPFFKNLLEGWGLMIRLRMGRYLPWSNSDVSPHVGAKSSHVHGIMLLDVKASSWATSLMKGHNVWESMGNVMATPCEKVPLEVATIREKLKSSSQSRYELIAFRQLFTNLLRMLT